MTDNLTPADLIYLYLDGEADSMQQTTMFASLATDMDMQQEFTEALSMRRAFERERTSTKPPMYLAERVFRDAGIIPTTIGASAVGSALWLWIKRASIPVGAMLFGGLLTYVGMNWSGSREATQPQQAQEQITSQPAFLNKEVQKPIASPDVFRSVAHQSTLNSRFKKNDVNMIDPTHDNDYSSEPFRSEQQSLSQASLYLNGPSGKRVSMVNVAAEGFSVGKLNDWTIQSDGLATADFYGATKSSSSVGIFRDYSISVLYSVDENFSVGLGFSNNSFAVSDFNDANGTQLPNQFRVLRVESQYVTQQSESLNSQYYFRGGFGADFTTSNSVFEVFNVGVGLSYPVWMFRFNVGLELDGLIYNNWSKLGGKGAVVTGVSYSFW